MYRDWIVHSSSEKRRPSSLRYHIYKVLSYGTQPQVETDLWIVQAELITNITVESLGRRGS